MDRVTRKSTVIGAALLFGVVANLGFVQPASAATDCSTARQVAVNTALSRGDIATASRAQGLCNNPCTSIESFYINYSGYLNSSYAEALILDAFRTCIANQSNNNSGNNGGNNNGGGDSSNPVKFKTVKAPAVSGSFKVGQTVKAINGKWSERAKISSSDWYICKSSNTKPQARIVDYSVDYLPFPTNGCATKPTKMGATFKLLSAHRGKHLVLCQDPSTDDFWGYYCTKSYKIS
jgi:hypothetical protein